MSRLNSCVHSKKVCLAGNITDCLIGSLQGFRLFFNITDSLVYIILALNTGFCILNKSIKRLGHISDRIVYTADISNHLFYSSTCFYYTTRLSLNHILKRLNVLGNLFYGTYCLRYAVCLIFYLRSNIIQVSDDSFYRLAVLSNTLLKS